MEQWDQNFRDHLAMLGPDASPEAKILGDCINILHSQVLYLTNSAKDNNEEDES